MIWFSYIDNHNDNHYKLIEIFTTSILYLQSKVNNKNDWAVFCSSQRPNKIGQTAENDGAAIPLPIFFLSKLKNFLSLFHPIQTRGEQIMTTKLLLAPPPGFSDFPMDLCSRLSWDQFWISCIDNHSSLSIGIYTFVF